MTKKTGPKALFKLSVQDIMTETYRGPERQATYTQISSEDHDRLYRWMSARSRGRSGWISFNDDIIGSGVYLLDEEPLVTKGILTGNRDNPVRYALYCSRKHARQLQEAGIVSFPETLKLGETGA